MSIQKIQFNEPRKQSIVPAAAVGAVAGMGARYVVPTKSELSGLLNKENVDKFVSSAAAATRGNARSAMKYAGIGAAIAAGTAALVNVFKAHKNPAIEGTIEYSKLGILLDAPDYAYEIYCYGDN